MKKDILKILLAYFLALAVVYVLPRLGFPQIISQMFFLLLIIYVFYSKDSIFWLTWYFVIVDAPGGIFGSVSAAEVYRLPLYNLGPGVSLGFHELFLFMFIFKWIMGNRRMDFIFKYQAWLILILGVTYFLISFFLGISASNIINTVRTILPWFWVLIIPSYVKGRPDLDRIFAMLLPFVLIAFISSFQVFFTGQFIRGILSGTSAVSRFGEASEENLLRVSSSFYIVFLSIIQSLYLIISRSKTFKPNVLLLVIAVATLTILFSGTRGWIIALVILFMSLFFVPGFSTLITTLRAVVIIVFLFIILETISPILPSQIGMSVERVLTLQALAEGDLTAGGTLSRLTERGPRVMAVWRESPLIGWAFSDTFYAYSDVHVGNQTNLLNLGILGFTLFNGIYLSILMKTQKWGRKLKKYYSGGNEYIVYLFALLALFFIHTSSGALWSFMRGGSPHSAQLLWGLLFTAIGIAISPWANSERTET